MADKPDSQDICFVPEGKYTTVIDKPAPRGRFGAGEIVHMDGRVLGRHAGVSRYTVGQRRGLKIAVGDPLFVVALDAAAKRVTVGPREALLTSTLSLKETNWLGRGATLQHAAAAEMPVLARVRSTRPPTLARLGRHGGEARLIFDGAEDGVSPGQACVLYDPETPSRVLGGGFIAATERAPWLVDATAIDLAAPRL